MTPLFQFNFILKRRTQLSYALRHNFVTTPVISEPCHSIQLSYRPCPTSYLRLTQNNDASQQFSYASPHSLPTADYLVMPQATPNLLNLAPYHSYALSYMLTTPCNKA
jgi:hypothetical protein